MVLSAVDSYGDLNGIATVVAPTTRRTFRMAQIGADVEQLDRLGAKFKEKAAEITQMQAQISSQLTNTWWKGADADKFRAQWEGDMRSQLTKLKTLLEATAQVVVRQASDQRAVSQN